MKALLVESITQSKTTKSTTMWTREGDFEPIETVKERYRDQPERWALIEKNAPRITCDVTGEELIVEPQYKLKVTDEEVCMEEKKKRIEGEATCKNPKKAKTAKAIKAVGGADETPTVVPEPQVARAAKCVPKLEEVKLKLTQNLLIATSQDMQKWMPSGIVDKAQDTKTHITEIIEELKVIIDSKMAVKGRPTELTKAAAQASAEVKELGSSIQTLAKMNGPSPANA